MTRRARSGTRRCIPSFATAANAVAGLYSAASAAQKSASAAGAQAVLVRRA